ncbi:MAG: hypothetical protein ABIJ65_14045 [Chloroflexota bacterium]
MKNRINRMVIVSILVLTLLSVTTPVFAAGGKVRGEAGQGSVVQVQEMDPPPFQP